MSCEVYVYIYINMCLRVCVYIRMCVQACVRACVKYVQNNKWHTIHGLNCYPVNMTWSWVKFPIRVELKQKQKVDLGSWIIPI